MTGDPRTMESLAPPVATPSMLTDSPGSLTATQPPVPPLAIKPSLGPSSPAVSSPLGIVTQKEWVVPPRPKPGRKPAVDNPPTKRKAQNRAAQRAFRERRAARIGELEERIKETEGEHEIKMKEMEVQISRLQQDVERFKGEVVAWKERCEMLGRSLEQERKEKESVSGAYNALREAYGGTARDSVPTQSVRQNKTSDLPHQRGLHEGIELIGCGNCTKDSHCECVAQAIDFPNLSYSADDFTGSSKRPGSPQTTAETTKRLRNDANVDPTDLETDFTALYSSTKRTAQSNAGSSADSELSASVIDGVIPTRLSSVENDMCGFCQDGTPCICADLSISIPPSDNSRPEKTHSLLPKFTPPPSDTDVTLPQVALPSLRSAVATTAATVTAPCTNGPGTCAQCRADPNSTLFCKTLAAIRKNNDSNKTDPQTPSPGCCGSGTATGAPCCRDPTNGQAVTLSCADTYQTLSRHPGYELASDQFGSWLSRLNASGVSAAAAATGRPAMEVEAASVMGVLRLFDRRFGRG
ncbi:hypothetical protein GP486_006485 [Trichoglossum hirsutum]|uniref:BZIP domain-containing protein n=1 Tax=Trichoglossum hirsutum TaxID=265104 RepID=A0A9P8L7T1_9PEZI|nr:hypothetical protein GP486_006485 [Trichoglossum hirsutum]